MPSEPPSTLRTALYARDGPIARSLRERIATVMARRANVAGTPKRGDALDREDAEGIVNG